MRNGLCALSPLTKRSQCHCLSSLLGSLRSHSGQTHEACAVPAIVLQKKIQTNVESFTLTVKRNAISENLSFLLRACVQNEVTGIHKFYRREILFIGHFMYRFHTNCPLVKVWIDSNFKTMRTGSDLVFCVWPLVTLGGTETSGSQRSNVWRVCSSRHNFTKTKTESLT